MLDEWRKCQWGDLVNLEYGKGLRGYENSDGPYLVFGTNGPIGKHSVPLCNHPGVIIGRKGAYRGVHYSNRPFFVIDTAFYLEPKEDIDLKWAYYELLTNDINSMDSGSAIPSTSRDAFYSLPVNVPPLQIQHSIAHVLGSLDDKIELNRQINETLEEIANSIFKSWFVDFDPVRARIEGRLPYGMNSDTAGLFPDSFEDSELRNIPRGWQITSLADVTTFMLGGDWGNNVPTKDATDPAYCIRGADIPDLQSGGMGKMPLRYLKPSSLEKRRLLEGDIVIEISGGSPTQSTGRPVLITEALKLEIPYPLVCSNFCRMLRLTPKVSPVFIYLWLRWLYVSDAFLEYENGTTGIKNLALTIFSEQKRLLLPPLLILNQFEQAVNPLFSALHSNVSQSRTLVAIRDALLPKLLSGEIRLEEAEKYVEALF